MNRIRRPALAVVALLLFAQDVAATVVVALVSADRIVIAVDSRATGQDGSVDDTVCKLYWNGEVALVASGLIYPSGGYAFETIGNDIFWLKGTPAQRLQYAVSRLAKRDPTGVAQGETLLSVAAYDSEPRAPLFSFAALPIPLPAGHVAEVSTVHDGVFVSRPKGAKTNIDSVAVRAWLSEGPSEDEMVAMARRFVDEQIERERGRTPPRVGGPVDVLVVDAQGGRWAAQKPVCR